MLMSCLLQGESEGGQVTHEDMRRCFFGDFMDTAADEPVNRK